MKQLKHWGQYGEFQQRVVLHKPGLVSCG